MKGAIEARSGGGGGQCSAMQWRFITDLSDAHARSLLNPILRSPMRSQVLSVLWLVIFYSELRVHGLLEKGHLVALVPIHAMHHGGGNSMSFGRERLETTDFMHAF